MGFTSVVPPHPPEYIVISLCDYHKLVRLFSTRFMEEQHMLGWNIPPEHADLVHIHWRNYPAPDNIWHFIMAGVYFTLMLLSTSGNGIVIYLFMT